MVPRLHTWLLAALVIAVVGLLIHAVMLSRRLAVAEESAARAAVAAGTASEHARTARELARNLEGRLPRLPVPTAGSSGGAGPPMPPPGPSGGLNAARSNPTGSGPPIGAGNPLVDVEPLVGGFVGLAYRPAAPGSAPTLPVEATPTPAPEATPAPAVAKVASVHGSVFAEKGHAALAQANVTFKSASGN